MIKATKKAVKKTKRAPKPLTPQQLTLQALAALPWVQKAYMKTWHDHTWYAIETRRNVLKRMIHSKYEPREDNFAENDEAVENNPSLIQLAKPYRVFMPRYKFYIREYAYDGQTRYSSYAGLLKKPKHFIYNDDDREKGTEILPIGGWVFSRSWKQMDRFCRDGQWREDFNRCKTFLQFADLLALYLQTAIQNTDNHNDLLSGRWAWIHGLNDPKAN